MTSEEYLRQAVRLDEKINSDLEELAWLRAMAGSVHSSVPRDRVQTGRRGEAPFVRSVEKILAMEEKIDREIDRLVDLREQIREVIDAVPNRDERMVLHCRYIKGMSWDQTALKLNAAKRTIHRWHASALQHVVLPEKPIVISEEAERKKPGGTGDGHGGSSHY